MQGRSRQQQVSTGVTSGHWYGVSGYTGIQAYSLNVEFAHPFFAPTGTRFDAIGVRAEAVAVAGNSCVVGIREMGNNGYPGRLISSRVLDLSTAGFKSTSITFVMPGECVWLTVTPQGVSDPPMRDCNIPMRSPSMLSPVGVDPVVQTVDSIRSVAADRNTAGVIPALFGVGTPQIDRHPFVYLRAA